MQYSQHDEEDHILAWFGYNGIEPSTLRPGRFLDIGAYTGVQLSNTRRLAEYGWSGVAIEPAAGPFRQLLANYAHLRAVQLVNAAIAPVSAPSLVEFRQAGDDAVGSMAANEDHLRKWSKAVEFQTSYVVAISVLDVMKLFPGPFDLISIDTEGMNLEVLQSCPIGLTDAVSLICVEVDSYRHKMQAILGGRGFREVVYESAENLVVGRPR